MKKIIHYFFIFSTIPLIGENLAVVKIADVPSKAIYITQPLSEKNRLFVVHQGGTINIILDNKVLKQPFLDISDRVHNSINPGSEKGLLGLAFHPNYKNNGYFFLNYVNKNNTSVVSRFSVTKNSNLADKHSEKILLRLDQPFDNHNGGHLTFGPKDGMLYIGFGDGGSSGDPLNNGQNLNTLHGSILRIDVDNGDPYGIPQDNPFVGQKNIKPEIFCYGLRNPWRFSFDKKTNDLIIGDVGQDFWEEINWTSWDQSKGNNFGWNIMEGMHCYDSEDFCDTTNLILPIHVYPNNAPYLKILIGMDDKEIAGCSVIGGYVYRGKEHTSLFGSYIFGDYCTGRIWSFKLKNKKISSFRNIRSELKKYSIELPMFISSFGKDSTGELYVVDYFGAIYKFISN